MDQTYEKPGFVSEHQRTPFSACGWFPLDEPPETRENEIIVKGLEAGQQVDQFRIVRKLGQGGMSEVYLARDTSLGRKVALKIIRAELAGSSRRLKLFLREARLTAKFAHPHIITIYFVGEFEGHPYLALEYLEGQTLSQRMREGTMSVRETIRIGLAIAQALEEAHSHSVLHRDLKPANVIIPQDGRIRVLDFGISKITNDHTNEYRQEETVIDEITGTPAYMAPERWLQENVTGAVDVWALGVILYMMLAKIHPFYSEDQRMEAIRQRILTASEPPPLPQDIAVPPEFSQLITAMLDAKPSRRPRSQQIVEVLKGLLQHKRGQLVELESPFRGLLPFSERHADLFFGRSAEIGMAIERLRREPILPLVGPSGAGKSSFVAAGIIPRLRELNRWLVLTVRPGTDPFGALGSIIGNTPSSSETFPQPTCELDETEVLEIGKDGLATNAELKLPATAIETKLVQKSDTKQEVPSSKTTRNQEALCAGLGQKLHESPTKLLLELQALADDTGANVLLFVDQLEELYTQDHPPNLRRAYTEAISRAADDPDGPIRVIFTLREDFLGHVADIPSAREVLSRIMVLRAPGEKALHEILRNPVELAGYSYEDEGLPEEMLDSVRDAPASLPILQFACSQLWNRRDSEKRLLTRAAYEEMGGVEGALASEADELLTGLTEGQRKLMRQLMLRLVTPEATRRVVTAQELLDGLDSDANLVLDRLTAARMVVSRRAVAKDSNEAELELVHDSLITSWIPLVRWLEQSREEVVFLDEVSRAAELWDSRGCPSEEVWTGEALDEALAKIKRCEGVPQRVTDFLEAAVLRRQTRARVRRKVVLAIIGTLLTVITVLAYVIRQVDIQREIAVTERDRQQQAHAIALREGARAAYTKGDFLEARSKLRRSLEAQDSTQARALWWLLENEPLLWAKSLDVSPHRVSVSPDGMLVAVATNYVNIVNFKTLEHNIFSDHKRRVASVDFSPDGRWLCSGAEDREIRLWDLRNGAVKVLGSHNDSILATVFSPDGRRLASGGRDRTIKIWDLESSKLIRTLKNNVQDFSVRFSPDSRFLISGSVNKKVHIWNAHSYELEQVIEEPEIRIHDAVTSADGKLLAYSGSGGVIVVKDLDTRQEIARKSGNAGTIISLSFSPETDFLAAAANNGNVLVWETKTWSLYRQFRHAKVFLHSVAFLPDGEHLISAGNDGTVKLWNMNVHSLNKTTTGPNFRINALDFAPDGETIATGSGVVGELLLWDVASSQPIIRIAKGDKDIHDVAFHRNGSLLSAGYDNGIIRLYSVPDGKLLKTLIGHKSSVYAVAFSPNGKQLVSSSYDKTVNIWDIESLTLSKSLPTRGSVVSMDFNSDGRLLALAHPAEVEVRDYESGQILQSFSGHTSTIFGVAFSSDGKSLFSSSWDFTAREHQLGSTSSEGEVVARHDGRVYFIDATYLSEDVLGTPSEDRTAKLWQIETGDVITLRGHQGEVNRLRFSPDGTRVATVSDDATLRLWETRTGKPLWRSPLMFEDVPLLFTQNGWVRLDHDSAPLPSTKGWQKAVENQGKLASASADRQTLCVVTFADELEIWNIPNDEREVKLNQPRITKVIALQEGCLTQADGSLTLTKAAGDIVPFGEQTEVINKFGNSVLALQRGRITVLDSEGNQQDEFTATTRISALTIVGSTIALGFLDGRIEIWTRDGASSQKLFACREIESCPVNRIVPGPPGTIIVGFANGTVGIWSLETGERLYAQRLHGPIIHLLHKEQMLFAATELGSKLRLDLSTFYADYCDLMERVWKSVPWIWEKGRPRFHERPNEHFCTQNE